MVQTGKEEGQEYRRTVSFDTLLQREVKQMPFKVFDEWPILEVRQACVNHLNETVRVASSSDADWAEARIRMIEAHEDNFEARKIWKELLSWYIFKHRRANSELASRALEFAITFAKENNNRWNYLQEVAKRVAGRIKDEPNLYWYVPSMREFMIVLLSQMKSGIADNSDWDYYTNRAVRTIVYVEDVELLPLLAELLSIEERREQLELLKAYRYEEKLSLVQRKAILQEAVRVLTKERAEQMPNINVVFGSYLREKAGLVGSVSVRLHYPQRVPAKKAGEAVKIRLNLEMTKPEEKEKLLPVLKCHAVEFFGEGFISSPNYPTEPQAVKRAFEGLSCIISALPTRGINRFSLRLINHEGEKKVSTEEVFGYILVE